jgi:hypothetical protein
MLNTTDVNAVTEQSSEQVSSGRKALIQCIAQKGKLQKKKVITTPPK